MWCVHALVEHYIRSSDPPLAHCHRADTCALVASQHLMHTRTHA